MLGRALGRPFETGNRVDVYRNGREIQSALLHGIRSAEHTIDFETYLYGNDPEADRFSRALGEAASRGVRTRVLLDGVGSWIATRRQAAALRKAGVDVRWFRSPGRWRVWRRLSIDRRTHRKILVVDGKAAYTGGAGVKQEWGGDARNPSEWRDTHFRILGPAVAGFHAAFAEHWRRSGDAPVAEAPEPSAAPEPETGGDAGVLVLPSVANDSWCEAAVLFHELPKHARRSMRITTPYFVPDGETRDALVAAAERGVAVEILVPGPHTDHHICQIAGAPDLRALSRAGVRIHLYQPTFVHTKTLTVDGELSVIGSANLNRRSIAKDDEILALVLDEDLTRTLDRHFERDVAESVPMDARHARPSWADRLVEKAVRVFARQL